MKISLNKSFLRNIITESFLNEMEKQKNSSFLDYNIVAGKEKDAKGNQLLPSENDTIGEYFINFYVPKNWGNIIKQKARFAIPRTKGLKNDDEMEFSIKIENPNGLFDKDGNVNNTNPSLPGFRDVKKLEIFYNLICAIKQKAGLPPVKESFENILGDISLEVRNRVTSEACSDAILSTYELWRDMCEKMDTQEIQQLIENLKISYSGLVVTDNQLKMQNRLRALAQGLKYGINVTYLATAKNWKELNNRRVNPNAHPFLLLFPWSGFATKDDMSEFAQMNGIESIDSLDPRQKYDLLIKANKRAPQGYGWAVYYDVSETTVIEGEDDAFNNTVGYENNLNGTPNQYTVNKYSNPEDKEKRDNAIQALDNKLYGNSERTESSIAYKAVYELAQDWGVPVAASADGSDKSNIFAIKLMVQDMAKEGINKQARILKVENAQPYVEYITNWVMLLLRLTPTFMTKNPNTSTKENIIAFNVMSSIINGVRDKINNAQIPINKGKKEKGTTSVVAEDINNTNIQMPTFEEFCNGIA